MVLARSLFWLVVCWVSRLFFGCLGRGNVLFFCINGFKVTMKVVAREFLTIFVFVGLGRRSVASPSQA